MCMPKDTRLNRHIAIFGASGTMKSRAIIRNALFQIIRRGESAILTDSKSEMYTDTVELFRNAGYEVKVFNLVNPEHGDSWNCMSDLNGDTLMAQVLTNVIIGNTSSGKGDHFWDNGEGNLLKALILMVDQDKKLNPSQKNLTSVYQMLTQNSEGQLIAKFNKLPLDHPARAPFNLFSQSSDTVKSGIILGLGTRLQVLQNKAVQRITSSSDIDLVAPAKKKCVYYIILSDQDATMSFLSSLFFSCMFIKLSRFADVQPGGRCPVPVNLILDEFNNVGRIGGAEDGSDFARSLSVVRSRDIRVMLAVQSLGQLQNRYPKNLWSEIIGNCDIQLMMGCSDDVSAEFFSARSGDMSVQVKSTMTVRQTLALAQVIPQYRSLEGHGRRRLLTNDRGYAKSADIPYGTYRVVETTFPFNYEGDGQTEWTVTINTAKGALATINASNKLKKGHVEILKSDYESGKDLSGAEFTVYDYDGEEVAVIGPTDSKGYAKSGEITYGSYIVKETKVPANYQPDGDAEWHITIDDNSPLITLDIANLRQYGSVKVVKTAEDGLVDGLKFQLTGTSVYGEEVNMTATTNEAGVAVFERVPIGIDYTLSEVSTPERYVIPEAQNITVKWNKVTERQFHNVLKKWRADIFIETAYKHRFLSGAWCRRQ